MKITPALVSTAFFMDSGQFDKLEPALYGPIRDGKEISYNVALITFNGRDQYDMCIKIAIYESGKFQSMSSKCPSTVSDLEAISRALAIIGSLELTNG